MFVGTASTALSFDDGDRGEEGEGEDVDRGKNTGEEALEGEGDAALPRLTFDSSLDIDAATPTPDWDDF